MAQYLQIDTIGMVCPLPILKLRKTLKTLAAGTIVEFWASDPMVQVDVAVFCAEHGLTILEHTHTHNRYRYLIQLGLAEA